MTKSEHYTIIIRTIKRLSITLSTIILRKKMWVYYKYLMKLVTQGCNQDFLGVGVRYLKKDIGHYNLESIQNVSFKIKGET